MFVLVGNPNVGKTVLFNALTKSNEKVGNWHGVTTTEKVKSISYLGESYDFVDLPGCYNLTGYSLEEKVTADYLNKDQKVINICNKSNLERNLYLTLLLIEKGYNVLLFINNFGKKQKALDTSLLSGLLGIEVLEASAKNMAVGDIISSEFRQGKLDYLDNRFLGANIEQKIAIRYKYIERLLQKCKYKNEVKQSKLDKILLNKFFAIPIFLMLFAFMFFICFGSVGAFLCDGLISIVNFIVKTPIVSLLRVTHASNFIYNLVVDGVLSSIIGLIGFLPQIVLVGLFINILEDSGYLSRIAFIFEGLLNKIGLSGKSIFSILISFGCNTTAVLTTTSQESKASKIKLCLLLPFVCCSAKLPIIVIFTKLLCDSFGFLLVAGLYIVTFFVGCFIMSIISKMFFREKGEELVLELPEYHFPDSRKCLRGALDLSKNFLLKIGTTIFLVNLVVWFLQSFDFAFRYNTEGSILRSICKVLSPVFAPIGLNNWGIVAALIVGIMAKELVITTLAVVNNILVSDFSLLMSGGLVTTFSPLTLIIFVIFVCLYSPCFSTLSAIKKEVGRKYAFISFLVNTLVAYFMCSLVYLCGMLVINHHSIFAIVIVGVLVILSLFIKSRCKGCCESCKNKKCKSSK